MLGEGVRWFSIQKTIGVTEAWLDESWALVRHTAEREFFEIEKDCKHEY